VNPVSGVVICFNEEPQIARCLESLSFCDEIVVVDSHSTDATREIAARFTDRVILREFGGYLDQKRFAIEQAKHDWIVSLDADEAFDGTAQASIRKVLAAGEPEHAGYVLKRLTYHLGVWHERGDYYPDRKLRFFRKSRFSMVGREPHEAIVVDGSSAELEGSILLWSYDDLADQIEQINNFSRRSAQAMLDEGVRFRLSDLLLRPLTRFLKGYVLKRGFLLGLPGFMVSVSSSYYVFMKYAKLWELEKSRRG
jgi:glycosyltransferase involved in cell wall biosynthesis